MYYERVTIPSGGSIAVGPPVSRGTRMYGVRVVAVVGTGQTPAEAYAGAALVMTQNIANPAAGFNPDPNPPTADTIPIVDDSYLELCSPISVLLESDNVGQEFDVFWAEGQAERIYPGGWGAIESGGGGGVTPVVTTTTEDNVADGSVPALTTEGADTDTATAIQVTMTAIKGTFLAQGRLEAWQLLSGLLWCRMPELDLDATPAGGSAAWAFEVVLLSQGGTVALPSRIAWRPIQVDDTDGSLACDLTYQVTTPQNPVQVLANLPDPAGVLNVNSAVTAPPVGATAGVDITGANSVQLEVSALPTRTISRAGSLAAFLLLDGATDWVRAPDYDLDIAGLPYYAVAPSPAVRSVIFAPVALAIPAGRIAWRPSGMAVSGGAANVGLNYTVAAPVTGAIVGVPVTEAGLATPNAAAPTLATEGVSLADVSAVLISVASTNGTDTIDAAGGFLAAYLYLTVGSGQVWVRAPSLDLYPTLGGQVALAFGAQRISVPTGRLAYRPSGLTLTPPGGTVDVTYQTAL